MGNGDQLEYLLKLTPLGGGGAPLGGGDPVRGGPIGGGASSGK